MPIVKIKTSDAAGQPLAKQIIKVSSGEPLVTNENGLAQFLFEDSAHVSITINDVVVWGGGSQELKREEFFVATAAGFSRV